MSQAANALTDLGVGAGDRVAIYMPMIPEVVVAMLACARLGAPHTVVFGGVTDIQGRQLGTLTYRLQGDAGAVEAAASELSARTRAELLADTATSGTEAAS